ncbi:putative xanthine dehydrogenase subunit A [Microbacterium lemovicicum]|uniref:Putative xanthine dehydrogenase subunit A n=1 Tax=Microbacterium lemovicicum TaxID=1072463 RepID=A0A3Q9J029_9MICO|nr:XdhC/CoxI family protein [Microbacterium lemovicicum]AZS37754.1 putative xanthine dehydrogenase subunit A [Microbacterium lemovicicum]
MLELAAALVPRLRAGERVAVITVTAVARSAPRGTGSSMAVTAGGDVIGSISGGCVEEDAVMLGLRALSTGSGLAASFGFTAEAAHAAGLACGGAIEVVAYPLSGEDTVAMAALEAALRDEPTALGLVVRDGAAAPLGTLLSVSAEEGVLTLSHAPRARLVILGAGDHAAALCRVAAAAGFAVTVCDGWGLLVTPERFPDADRLVVQAPDQYLRTSADEFDARTAICVLTHDERVDIPALAVALRLPVAFVGAMGARSTVGRRAGMLREAGLDDDELARLHSPLGLDLGGESPEETAVAILAEIIAGRRSGSGLPLRALSTPIHGDPNASCAAPRVGERA